MSDQPLARGPWLIVLSVALWLVTMAWNWPVALSLEDEVGYVGQTRLFLEGRVRPSMDSPGIWHETLEAGLIGKYPLFHPAVLTPFMAVSPRSAFLLGPVTAVLLVILAGHLLRQWGKDPLWSVLLLAQPAVTLVSRTVMADLLLSAFLLGTYASLRANRWGLTVVLVAATAVAKPTGPVLASLLIGGDILANWQALRARDRTTIRKYVGCGLGLGIGIAVIVGTNLIANGTPWYGYHERFGPPTFMPKFLFTSGAAHVKSLLLLPPLLLIGVWPYWARRDFGPLAVIVGLVGLMAIYYFVDTGRNWIDSLVMSQRLILPAVVFLMIGYAALLANAFAWAEGRVGGRIRMVGVAGLLVLPGVVGHAIATRHRRWQEPMRQSLAAVTEVAASLGTDRIALSPTALKHGLMFRGKTTMHLSQHARLNGRPFPSPEVILCATKSSSYRLTEAHYSCGTPGYRIIRELPGYQILVRKESVP